MIKCLFCGRFVKIPRKLEEIYRCKCGAYYFACEYNREPEMVMRLHKTIYGEGFLERLPVGTWLLELRREGFYDQNFNHFCEPPEEPFFVVPFVRKLRP